MVAAFLLRDAEIRGRMREIPCNQCCAILIGIGVISVLKSKIFDTFGIVSVLVLKEVCNRYWYWSRYCKKSLRGISIGIGIET